MLLLSSCAQSSVVAGELFAGRVVLEPCHIKINWKFDRRAARRKLGYKNPSSGQRTTGRFMENNSVEGLLIIQRGEVLLEHHALLWV